MISISAFGQQPVNEGFKKCSNHHCVCREKTRLLSRQKYACRDKSFVMKKCVITKQMFSEFKQKYDANINFVSYHGLVLSVKRYV